MPTVPQPPEIHYPTDILPPLYRLSLLFIQEAKALQRFHMLLLSCCCERSSIGIEREDVPLWSGCAVQGVFVGRHVSREVLWVRLIQQIQLDGRAGVRKMVCGQAGWLCPSGAVQGVFGLVQM